MATNWIDKGGYFAYDRLSAKLRFAAQPLMPLKRFVRDEPVLGSMAGDTVNITHAYDLSSAYPTSPLTETAPMPENASTEGTVTLTLDEWGDTVPFTEKFMRLSDFSPEEITTKRLMKSMALAQNYEIIREMKTTDLKYGPTSATATTTGTFSAVGADPGTWLRSLNVTDLLALRAKALDTYGIPPLTGPVSEVAQFGLVCSQTVLNNFLVDSSIAAALNASFTGSGASNPLLKGTLGVAYGVLFMLDTSGMLSSAAVDSTFTGEALFFGDDAVVSATALYPEIRVKTPEDYGRDRGIGWYGIYGYKLVGGSTAAEIAGGVNRVIHLTGTAN